MPATGLSTLTAEEVRKIGVSYELKLTGELGTTPARWAVLVLTILALLWSFLEITSNMLDPPFDLLGFVGFLMILAGNGGLQAFVVNVPAYSGLLVTNKITGALHVYPAGIHVRFPWDRYSLKDFISVRPDTLEKTTTFQTKDGIPVTYRWGIIIGPSMRMLAIFIRNDMETIKSSLEEIGETALASLIAAKTAVEMRQPQTIEDTCKKLDRLIRKWTDSKGNTIERRSGSSAERATISPPTFSQDYNEGTTTMVLADMVNNAAKRIEAELHVSPEAALNAVLMMNKENIKKTIAEVTAGKDFVEALRELGLGAGRVIQGVQRILPTSTPPSAGS
ncbi:MAG: hypothetical protein MN733_43220 [Nitrososphaera sp.]|nr:hypothetical protein [Nitrososphaera sp.]